MKLSFIIPVYNGEKYLSACLDSILSQSYTDWEAWIIDDGSNDSSRTIAQGYQLRDKRFNVLSQANAGPGAARNTGLQHVTGQWIAFVDADDAITPIYASVMLEMAEKNDADVSICQFSRSQKLSKNQNPKCHKISAREAVLRTLYQDGINSGPWGKLYRRELFDKVKFQGDIYYEDMDLNYRILQQAKSVVFTWEKYYFYRDHPQSIMNNFIEKRLDVLTVADAIEQHFASDPEMLAAARDRKFAANCNMYLLCRKHHRYKAQQDKCLQVIKAYRHYILHNPHSRIKNKLGAILSYILFHK